MEIIGIILEKPVGSGIIGVLCLILILGCIAGIDNKSKSGSDSIAVSTEIPDRMNLADLHVFATPAMVALMENAAMMAVAEFLPEGSTTVGAMMNTSHVKPSPIDESIKATAVLTEVEGRKLTFEIKAEDSKGVIGEATHIRYIVDRERFMSKL